MVGAPSELVPLEAEERVLHARVPLGPDLVTDEGLLCQIDELQG